MFLDKESLLSAIHHPQVLATNQSSAGYWTGRTQDGVSCHLRNLQVESRHLLQVFERLFVSIVIVFVDLMIVSIKDILCCSEHLQI